MPVAILPSDITSKAAYLDRRALIGGALSLLAAPAIASPLTAQAGRFSTSEPKTPLKDITDYTNFYEFGSTKSSGASYASALTIDPWQLKVDGLVGKPRVFDLDWLRAADALEERIYRHRCVEAWSMVVPWIGFPLARLIKEVEPLGSAKYLRFETLERPAEMRGQKSRGIIDWPYVEALRMDEAMHPLAILAIGLYGETLPKQNGAPVRLVLPWKYGFKSIKSLVRITFHEQRPKTTWETLGPDEYGFYANVNPNVDHPRWSQASERRIGESSLFTRKRPTLMFNGYADEVASLYSGMDLKKNF